MKMFSATLNAVIKECESEDFENSIKNIHTKDFSKSRVSHHFSLPCHWSTSFESEIQYTSYLTIILSHCLMRYSNRDKFWFKSLTNNTITPSFIRYSKDFFNASVTHFYALSSELSTMSTLDFYNTISNSFSFSKDNPFLPNIIEVSPHPKYVMTIDDELLVSCKISDNTLDITLHYIEELFTQEFILSLSESIKITLLSNIKNLDKKLNIAISENDLSLINSANCFEHPYVSETLCDLVWSGMEKFPDNIAVIDKFSEYSHASIKNQSESIAKLLIKNGAKPNNLIAIYSEKGFQHVISTFAITKSGAAYLPLNSDWPLGRIIEILTDGDVKIVLISKKMYKEHIRGLEVASQYQFIIIEDSVTFKDDSIAFPTLFEHDLAYVIFTSGSTGKPKGVAITHHNASNTIVAVNNYFNVNATTRTIALSELSFDLSVYDLFGPIACGGAIVFPDPERSKEPNHWSELLHEKHVTLWNSVPQLMQLMSDYCEMTHINAAKLSSILLSGDWIPIKLYDQLKNVCHNPKVVSLGGATEGGIWSIWYEIKNVLPHWKSIPYGVAMPNQKMYVLNHFQEHLPIGTRGEIYIGGEGVAKEYWRDSVKTSSSFIHHPTLGKIYKTGDAGKWNSAGYIEFDGRIDFQVKVNGYRIELGEIELRLNEIVEIDQSLVTAIDDESKNKYLCAYYESDSPLDEKLIRSYISQTLPEYMIPKIFMHLEKFPLTVNGKIDRKALPTPKFTLETLGEYFAPRTTEEEKIASIYSEVLATNRVGIDDNFYALGGTSLKAIHIATKLQSMGFIIAVTDIFKYKTIRELSDNKNLKVKDLKEMFNEIRENLLASEELKNSSHFKKYLSNFIKSEQDKIELPQFYTPLKINTILLTGATGYLGLIY